LLPFSSSSSLPFVVIKWLLAFLFGVAAYGMILLLIFCFEGFIRFDFLTFYISFLFFSLIRHLMVVVGSVL